MTSFIVVSKEKDKRKEHELSYCKNFNIVDFDITYIDKETLSVKQTVQSIGIDDIKKLYTKLYLKPLKSKTKAIIVEDAQTLTIEAQNALLKTLEEPPDNTIIMLGTDNKEVLLPTILSRCQIIELEEEKKHISQEESSEISEFIEKLSSFTIADCLEKAESLNKDKSQTLVWLENAQILTRNKLIIAVVQNSKQIQYYLTILTSLQKLYVLLKTTNVNMRFAIENSLLSLTT